MRRPVRNLLWMGMASLAILLAVAPFERFLAKAAFVLSWQFLKNFFNMNLYEHGVFGLADIVVVTGAASMIVYGLSFTPFGERLVPYRRGAGFVLNAGFTIAVSIVHAIKWVIARARPHDMESLDMENFTHWWEFGNYSLQVGFNRGAFPGGHVATMSVLLAFFYLMPDSARFRRIRWIYAGGVVLLALLMGWYRMMDITHWMTDNLASLFLSLMSLYALYHFIHFPNDHMRKIHPWTASVDDRRPGWEFFFLGTTLAYMFSVASIFVGFRIAVIHGDWLFGTGVFILGNVLSMVFFEIIYRILFRKSFFKGLLKR